MIATTPARPLGPADRILLVVFSLLGLVTLGGRDGSTATLVTYGVVGAITVIASVVTWWARDPFVPEFVAAGMAVSCALRLAGLPEDIGRAVFTTAVVVLVGGVMARRRRHA